MLHREKASAEVLHSVCSVYSTDGASFSEGVSLFFPLPQVLKVAILAEKYAVDYTWYVDTILNLIRIAGDYVSEEVWYRVIQIVINRDDVQGYAAKTVFEVWLTPAADLFICSSSSSSSFFLE